MAITLRSELLSTTAKVPDGTLGGRIRTFNYRGSDHDDTLFLTGTREDGTPFRTPMDFQEINGEYRWISRDWFDGAIHLSSITTHGQT